MQMARARLPPDEIRQIFLNVCRFRCRKYDNCSTCLQTSSKYRSDNNNDRCLLIFAWNHLSVDAADANIVAAVQFLYFKPQVAVIQVMSSFKDILLRSKLQRQSELEPVHSVYWAVSYATTTGVWQRSGRRRRPWFVFPVQTNRAFLPFVVAE